LVNPFAEAVLGSSGTVRISFGSTTPVEMRVAPAFGTVVVSAAPAAAEDINPAGIARLACSSGALAA
jgi:hypothetical protein